jgi:hypothetical protein
MAFQSNPRPMLPGSTLSRKITKDLSGEKFIYFAMSGNRLSHTRRRVVVNIMLRAVPNQKPLKIRDER